MEDNIRAKKSILMCLLGIIIDKFNINPTKPVNDMVNQEFNPLKDLVVEHFDTSKLHILNSVAMQYGLDIQIKDTEDNVLIETENEWANCKYTITYDGERYMLNENKEYYDNFAASSEYKMV